MMLLFLLIKTQVCLCFVSCNVIVFRQELLVTMVMERSTTGLESTVKLVTALFPSQLFLLSMKVQLPARRYMT